MVRRSYSHPRSHSLTHSRSLAHSRSLQASFVCVAGARNFFTNKEKNIRFTYEEMKKRNKKENYSKISTSFLLLRWRRRMSHVWQNVKSNFSNILNDRSGYSKVPWARCPFSPGMFPIIMQTVDCVSRHSQMFQRHKYRINPSFLYRLFGFITRLFLYATP